MANLENLKKGKPFVKNDPRINRTGENRKLPELDKLLAKILSEPRGNLTTMEKILHKQALKAIKGDSRCAELLMDRAYGKTKSTDPPPVINVNMPSISIKYRNE